ncbi:MAG: hypothetical protein ACJZ17_04195 [Acidimicrobiales bacterium]
MKCLLVCRCLHRMGFDFFSLNSFLYLRNYILTTNLGTWLK